MQKLKHDKKKPREQDIIVGGGGWAFVSYRGVRDRYLTLSELALYLQIIPRGL